MKKLSIVFVILCSFYSQNLYSRVQIGTREVIKRVADLPNNDNYLADDGSGNDLNVKLYLDLAIKYKSFGVGSASFWIVEDPIFVGINNFNREDGYYDLTEEEVSQIIKDNNLDREEMLNLSLWQKHGGLIIGLILVGLYLLYLRLSPKEKEDEIERPSDNNSNIETK